MTTEFTPKSPDRSIESGENRELLFAADSRAMAQLAQGTSVVIASLLTIPDAIALIPNATSIIGWLLQLLGIWLSAAVLWFVGFLAILHGCNFFVQGVRINEKGVKLWRFARPISWSSLEAVAVEPQHAFTRLFSLPNLARRLTLFESRPVSLDDDGNRKKAKNVWQRFAEARIVPHYVPSFLFSPQDFDALCKSLSMRRFDLHPDASDWIALHPQSMARMKTMYRILAWQRVLLTILIAVGMISLLGRKAAQNYYYNLGNKVMAARNFEEAKHKYQKSVAIEPTFAAGWNNLGNAEFRLGDYKNAKAHWHRALLLKPDFVEAKTSLAYMSLRQRDFAKTRDYIDAALALAPMNPTALVGRADYELRYGRILDAINDARLVLAQPNAAASQAGYTAVCIIAQAKCRLGEVQEARKILDSLGPTEGSATAMLGANLTYRLLVSSEIELAEGQFDQAMNDITRALERAPNSSDLLLQLAEIQIAQGKLAQAAETIAQLAKLVPDDPWVYITSSRIKFLQKDIEGAHLDARKAIVLPNQDAESLAQCASIYSQLNDQQAAVLLARKSLAIEPTNNLAQRVLRESPAQALQRAGKTSWR